MAERICTYKIHAWVDGKKESFACNPEEGVCLKELVWSGIGVKAAAEKALDLPEKSVTDAYVNGSCLKIKQN
ncbi:MAG: hypothetical protein UW20_C0021G0005 [Candidatus Woesebacteria bacterium GW2011_GWB1_44_11]|uniref:Uncharacterized protein n=2 Tax=Candidatus Woeseibacteriota TaxID=1752722 RepID=A0A1F8DIP4_9BACT|nr:MAG: hypothetical protein UW20_C0021G0005 [Candidatus Woesebacteria bacterium GW2011_GWB1_44_11]OGM76200.1 MAG: hypothetical protein A2208_01605 [Candidatus Woesebacteria bacterium RIFOXYA1_FULL_43_16]OGM88474.1 MAG: hypothetical protein A2573_01390 [Candidatus Woesebacteria bacterium RIFOXYD1_FULL_43_18]